MAISTRKLLTTDQNYGYDHPEVIHWTKYYSELAKKEQIFSNYYRTLSSVEDKFEMAEIVAQSWYEFACFVPVFLSMAVTKVHDPEWQHNLIQIAYEELGGRFKKNIHSQIFVECAEKLGIHIDTKNTETSLHPYLKSIYASMSSESEHGILGLLLSFEIIALENIEALFHGMKFSEEAGQSLDASRFFRIHRQDETEHIRHSIANFLRYCSNDSQKSEFDKFFKQGIEFWKRFWDQMSRAILRKEEERNLLAAIV